MRTVIYVTNIGDADAVGRAHSEVFGNVRPASTMVQVSSLIRPEMLVEIESVCRDQPTLNAADVLAV